MPRILNNTKDGQGFYNADENLYCPGKVSETEALIYCWVKRFFGESEANDPSWNIHELAQYLDTNRGTIDNQGFLEEGTVGCECDNEDEAEELGVIYNEDITELENQNKLKRE